MRSLAIVMVITFVITSISAVEAVNTINKFPADDLVMLRFLLPIYNNTANFSTATATTFCLLADSCITSWPSGGGGGGNTTAEIQAAINGTGNHYLMGYANFSSHINIENNSEGIYMNGTSIFRTPGSRNVFIGDNAGNVPPTLTTGYQNVFLGDGSGTSITSGFMNFGLGYQSLWQLTTGDSNVCIGRSSCYSLTTGDYSVGIGRNSLRSATGSRNIGIGYLAGDDVTSGASNILIGYLAGDGSVTTANHNILIGDTVDTASSSISHSIGLGRGVNVTNSNDFSLGPYIYTVNFTNTTFYADNITSMTDYFCNATECYTIADFLLDTVGGGADTNASTECDGSTTYLDGDGNCDTLNDLNDFTDSGNIYQNDIYQSCSPGYSIRAISDAGAVTCEYDNSGGCDGDYSGTICVCDCAESPPETPYLYDWNGTFLRKVAHNLLELKGLSMIPLPDYNTKSNFTFTIANQQHELEYFEYIVLNQRCHFESKAGMGTMQYKQYSSDVADLAKNNERYIYLERGDNWTFAFTNITIPAFCVGADFISYQLEISGYYELLEYPDFGNLVNSGMIDNEAEMMAFASLFGDNVFILSYPEECPEGCCGIQVNNGCIDSTTCSGGAPE